MNCEQMTALLSAFVDGELTAQEEMQVREHLEQCAQCRALYEQLQTLHTSFSDLEEIPVPENFAQGVMERIRAEEKPRGIFLFKRSRFRAVVGLAACAALCIGFGRVALDSGSKSADMALAGAPEAAAAMPESGVVYDMHAAVRSTAGGGMESQIDHFPAELAEPEAAGPEMPASPAAAEPGEAQAEVKMDTAISEKAGVGSEIILTELPEGFEASVGPQQWEERSEDGALCAQLTAAQAEMLLELAAAQGLAVEQTVSAEGERWTLVLKP